MCEKEQCATNADCRLADRRPADLQTYRLADLQTSSELTGGGGGIIAPAGIRPTRAYIKDSTYS